MNLRIHSLRPLGVASALALLTLLPASATPALDAFIRFGEPESGSLPFLGESTDRQFLGREGWSRVLAFDGAILNTIATGSGADATGKPEFRPFAITKAVETGSPNLFGACTRQTSYDAVQLVFRKRDAGIAAQPFFRATLRRTNLQSIQWAGASGDVNFQEKLNLIFDAIEWSYTMVDPEGRVISTTTVNLDLFGNAVDAAPEVVETTQTDVGSTFAGLTARNTSPVVKTMAQVVPGTDAANAPVEGRLGIHRLNDGWLDVQFVASAPGPVRLQTSSVLDPSAWHDLAVAAETTDHPRHYRWLVPTGVEGQEQQFFRVHRGTPPNTGGTNLQ